MTHFKITTVTLELFLGGTIYEQKKKKIPNLVGAGAPQPSARSITGSREIEEKILSIRE